MKKKNQWLLFVAILVVLAVVFVMIREPKTIRYYPEPGILAESKSSYGVPLDWQIPNDLIYFTGYEVDPTITVLDDVTGGTTQYAIPIDCCGVANNPAFDPGSEIAAFEDNFDKLIVYDFSTAEELHSTSGTLPVFLPDMTRLSFWREFKLVILDLMSGNEEVVYDLESTITVGFREFPAMVYWNPKNLTFVFDLVNYQTETSMLYYVDLSSQEITQLFTLEGALHEISWSPDGRMLAYVNGRYPDAVLMIYDLENRCVIETGVRDPVDTAIWSPDGNQILYQYRLETRYLMVKEYFGVEYQNLTCPGRVD